MSPPSQTLVLKDVQDNAVENVIKKYKAMGANIELLRQDNGKYTIRITIEPSQNAM